MYPSLLPFMLGINATLPESIELAARHGFVGVDVDGAALLSLSPAELSHIRQRFEQTNTRPGYIALTPGRIPVEEPQWQEAIAGWPQILQNAQALGYERAALVLLPFHETLEREVALEEHTQRLRKVAPILEDYGLRLGLEYVAAPSRRAAYSTHTVWNLAGTLELLERIGAPNMGLMLDTFHWHGAGETAADLGKLRAEQIVVVHANDAPDIPLEKHIVTKRALPGTTGVIDSATFFRTLNEIGYDGPVTCEPMQSAIDALEAQTPDEICRVVKQSLDTVLAF